MSMLSAQIDKLRKLAEYYDGSEVASIMRYAADTIWQLRDDLQRTNAENAVLRTQLADVTESMGRVEERCAKLRELVRDMYLCSDETCTDCEHHDYSGEGFWCKRGVGWKKARMRELGVEVS